MDRLEEIAQAYELTSDRPGLSLIPRDSVGWLIAEARRLRHFFTGEYICQKCWLRQDELTEKHEVDF